MRKERTMSDDWTLEVSGEIGGECVTPPVKETPPPPS
jgi:hypothetical protein